MPKTFRSDYGVYCCPHVFRKERPILVVIRDPDGEWQFLCGVGDDTDGPHLVGMGHLIERDPSLGSMAELEVATGAERTSVDAEWKYFELEN